MHIHTQDRETDSFTSENNELAEFATIRKVEVSYDGGRLCVTVNGIQVLSTWVSHDWSVKLENEE